MPLYGRVIDNALDGPIRRPRNSGETKITDGTTVKPGVKGWTDELLAACGFVEAVEDRPALGADEVLDGYADTLEGGIPTRTYAKRTKTAEELAVEAEAADRESKRQAVGGAVATLRQWSDDAESTTVNATNAVAVLQQVVNRLGVFFDRFADLIEAQRIDAAGGVSAPAAPRGATTRKP